MNTAKFTVNQRVYRPAGDVLDIETITRVVTDLRGQHWYYTITADGQRRTFALVEREIREVRRCDDTLRCGNDLLAT